MNNNSFVNFVVFIGGVAIVLLFLFAGIYFSIWTMLVGGIVQIVNACQVTPVPGSEIAWGILKIILCEIPFTLGVVAAMFTASCMRARK